MYVYGYMCDVHERSCLQRLENFHKTFLMPCSPGFLCNMYIRAHRGTNKNRGQKNMIDLSCLRNSKKWVY